MHKTIKDLINRRIKAGISQEALALEMGCKQTHISRLEKEGANPTLDKLTKWNEALTKLENSINQKNK